MTAETIAIVASPTIAALVAIGALANWYARRREKQLRRDDVLIWANEAIAALQSVVIVCQLSGSRISDAYANARMSELVFETSILVERGRLFFKNVRKAEYGTEKPIAYQGLRPKILDYLVIGHQVACAWPTVVPDDAKRLGCIAEDSLKEFVSIVQKEVGRDRASFGGANKEGYGVHLPTLLAHVDEARLHQGQWLR